MASNTLPVVSLATTTTTVSYPLMPISKDVSTIPTVKLSPKLLPLPNTTYNISIPTIAPPLPTIQKASDSIVIPTLPPVAYQQVANPIIPDNRVFTPQFQKGVVASEFKPSNKSLEIKPIELKLFVSPDPIIIGSAKKETGLAIYGYTPLIVHKMRNYDNKLTVYVKAINKKGQRVFILFDTSDTNDNISSISQFEFTENKNANTVPHSIKNGAYSCAGHDVCGIAFECGTSSICILARDSESITPTEHNYVLLTVNSNSPKLQNNTALELPDNIMSYPILRLSEIKVDADAVLENSDAVTRRLRNSAYIAETQNLSAARTAIVKLYDDFVAFDAVRQEIVTKLNNTLPQLEEWNDIYIANPPVNEEDKQKYRQLQYNLACRNESIATLIRAIKKVGNIRSVVDNISRDVSDVTEYCRREFANIEFANVE